METENIRLLCTFSLAINVALAILFLFYFRTMGQLVKKSSKLKKELENRKAVDAEKEKEIERILEVLRKLQEDGEKFMKNLRKITTEEVKK